MTLSSVTLGRSGAGSWIFVTALFPSVIFFSMALIWSVVYFYSASSHSACSLNVEVYFFASIGAAHLYVMLHGFSLVGPAFTTFHHMIKALVLYTVALTGLNVFGSWAVFVNHVNETKACQDSYIFLLSRVSNIVFYAFILGAIILYILAQCSTLTCCACLRINDMDDDEEEDEEDGPEGDATETERSVEGGGQVDGGSHGINSNPASDDTTLRNRRM